METQSLLIPLKPELCNLYLFGLPGKFTAKNKSLEIFKLAGTARPVVLKHNNQTFYKLSSVSSTVGEKGGPDNTSLPNLAGRLEGSNEVITIFS